MSARVVSLPSFTAACNECIWAGPAVGIERIAQLDAEAHNRDHHGEADVEPTRRLAGYWCHDQHDAHSNFAYAATHWHPYPRVGETRGK